jgi:predicted transcriptional regulator
MRLESSTKELLMTADPFTIRPDTETLRQLDEIGKATAQSREELVDQALERFIADETASIKETISGIKRGRAQIDAGQGTKASEALQQIADRHGFKLGR